MRKIFIYIAILISVSSQTYAQSENSASKSDRDKSYVGVEAGSMYVGGIASKVAYANAATLVNYVGGSVNYTYSNSVTHSRFYGGRFVDDNLGFEVGGMSIGSINTSYAGRSSGGVSYTASDNYSTQLYDASITYRGDQSSPYGYMIIKAGVHYGIISEDTSVTVSGTTYKASYSKTGVGPMVAFSYDKQLGKDFDVRATYSYYSGIAGVSGLTAYTRNVGIVYKF